MVTSGEVPWQVGLCWRYSSGRVSYPYCGATIISRWHVVTAAHCTEIDMAGTYTILFGSLKNYNSYRMVDVAKVFDHPNYNSGNFHNDIAVLKLQRAMVFNNEVRPACLPRHNADYSGQNSITSGWGHTSYQGSSSSVLLKVELPLGTASYCSRYWRAKFNRNIMVCAEVVRGKDNCQGDSGGPLVVENGGSWDLVGVVSAGFKCDAGMPGLYTKVSAFVPWINGIVCQTSGDYYCSK